MTVPAFALVPVPRRLYHFTCRHASRMVGRQGDLRPGEAVNGLPPLVWLTDLPQPDRDGLGLTSHMLDCDRTERRYVTRGEHGAVPWADFVRVNHVGEQTLAALHIDGARPEHWFVTRNRVWVRRA